MSLRRMMMASGISAPLWTPLSLLPKVWLNDDSSVDVNGSNLCQGWSDISGNGTDLLQSPSSDSSKPLIVPAGLNGRRITRFNGTSAYLQSNSTAARDIMRNVGYGYMAGVYSKTEDTTDAFRGLIQFSVGTDSNERATFAVGRGTAGGKNIPYVAGRRLDTDLAAGAISDTAFIGPNIFLAIIDYANRTFTLRMNGSLTKQVTDAWLIGGATSNTTSFRPLRLGCSVSVTPDNFANADVGEIIIGSGAPLAAGDDERIEGYLAHRWSLTSLLPGGHPYKTVAPTV